MTPPRRPIAAKTAYKELENENGELVTWWYCGICRRSKTNGEPKVLVCFRRILPDGQLGDFKHIRIPITALGQFTLGTIWKDQKRFEEIDYVTKLFHVDLSPDGWEFRSAADDKSAGRPDLIPQSIYSLPEPQLHDLPWMIRFNAADTKGSEISLLVPCMEFFSRCYGRSQFIKLILSSYPWNIAKDKFFKPLPQKPKDDKWYIYLRDRALNGDSVFLAHAYYDEYANKQARDIWNQIESAFGDSKVDIASPRIGPWFTGLGAIKVNGIWIEEGKSFLALQIIGSTDPGGVTICRGRQNSTRKPPTTNGCSNDDQINIPKPKIFNPPPIITVTGAEEPSGDTGAVIVDDNNYEVLGTPRRVKRVKFDSEQNTYRQVPVRDEDLRLFSGGESYGSGTGVGYAMYKSEQIMESQGKLRDIWNALLWFHDNYPDTIGHPESFTYEGKFSDNPEPMLLAYQAFDGDTTDITRSVRSWPFFSVQDGVMRGALLARIKVGDENIHFIEIQRRIKITEDDSGNDVFNEESFRGLVFKLKDNNGLNDWIDDFMNLSRSTEGLLAGIAPKCPGTAELYKHNTAQAENITCEAAIRNAFRKMGIKLHAL